jgi:hypothetical protein
MAIVIKMIIVTIAGDGVVAKSAYFKNTKEKKRIVFSERTQF